MAGEMVLDLLSSMKEAGVINVRFTGGEPTTREDWPEILKFARELGLVISLSSNGVFQRRKNIERLKEIAPEQVTLSIDGLEKNHDAVRGSGTYRMVLRTLEELSGIIKNLRLTTVLTRRNIGDIEGLVELAGRYVKVINFVCLRPIGRASSADSLLLSYEEHLGTAKVVRILQDKYPGLLIIHSDLPLPELFSRSADSVSRAVSEAGAFRNTYMAISADGSFWPHHYLAHQMQEFRLGRFPEDSVAGIWSGSAKLDGFRAWSKALWDRCNTCAELQSRCAGINFEMEVSRLMGDIPRNPYCISTASLPSPLELIR